MKLFFLLSIVLLLLTQEGECKGATVGGAGKLIEGLIKLGKLIRNAARRSVVIVNEDDHDITFECCQKGECRGKHSVIPGNAYSIDFIPNVRTQWWCYAWFNGPNAKPMHFDVWKGHGSSVKYMVRKNDGIYRANLNGSGEKQYVKFT